ncbi:MAG: DUF2065 domain-containing protein [Alphaproteobacteria bacterium]
MIYYLATAFAIVLVVEGLLYALFPSGMKRIMEQAMMLPSQSLRTSGLGAAVIGVFILWLLRF